MTARSSQRGVSLTELLVVVTVILVLLALLIVGVDQVYSESMSLKCRHRLEQIGYACQMYMQSEDGRLPRAWCPYSGRIWYETLANGWVEDPRVLACPLVDELPTSEGSGTGADPTREHTDTLLSALRWIKDKQETSGTYKGRWRYKDEGSTTGYYQGVTGLALLCYLGFGCTDKHPPEFAETVRMAVEYLSSDLAQYKTGADAGRFKNNTSKEFYGQGICTMALAGASRMLQDAALRNKARQAAQLAINYIAAKQPSHGAFGYYGDPGEGYSDTSVCGWVYQGVAACAVAQVGVPSSVIDRAELCLAAIHDSSGRSTYWWTYPNGGGAWLAERHTPIALTMRRLMGHPAGAADSQLQANWLMSGNRIINYQTGRNGKDIYGLYYTSLAMYRMGGTYWSTWHAFYPDQVLLHMQYEGTDMVYWPADCCGSSSQYGGGTDVGKLYATAMAALTLESAFEEHWINPSWTPPTGKCSYGYNNRLGVSQATPAADTILVMDYEEWEIDHDTIDVDNNDDDSDIAPRHSGRANALMGDWSVRAFYPEEITLENWTVESAE